MRSCGTATSTLLQTPDWIEREEFEDFEVERIESHSPATVDEHQYTEHYWVKYVGFEEVYKVKKADTEGCRILTGQYWRETWAGERETEVEKSAKKAKKPKIIENIAPKRSKRLAEKNP